MRSTGLLLLTLALATAPITAAPVGAAATPREDGDAHWLVTADGERIETRGPWRVEGKRVLFTASNGSLSSVRLDDVDLEASRAASDPAAEEARLPKPPLEESERPKARLVLTDQDIPPMTTSQMRAAEAGAAANAGTDATTAPSESPAAATADGISVVEWRKVSADGASDEEGPLQIFGTVRNDGRRRRDDVQVVVVVYDEADNEVARQVAQLQSSSLRSGESTSFRASFSELFQYQRVEIETGER